MTENDPNRAAARADFCRFLAVCYYEPGPEFAEEKLFESMVAAGSLVDAEFAAGARRLGEAFAAVGLEELLIDYTRLFLGPIDAPAMPYGSVWLGTDEGTDAGIDDGGARPLRGGRLRDRRGFPRASRTTSRPSSNSSTSCCSARAGEAVTKRRP